MPRSYHCRRKEYKVWKWNEPNGWSIDDSRNLEWRLTFQRGKGERPIDTTEVLASDSYGQEFSEVSLVTRVILTELISNVRGQLGDEKYLASYLVREQQTAESSPNLMGKFDAIKCHPILPNVADKVGPGPSKGNRRLRLRVVEFQVVDYKRKDGKPTGDAPQLLSDMWSELFPLKDATNDSRARIVRVSPPIDVSELAPK